MLKRYNPAQIKNGDRFLIVTKPNQLTVDHHFLRRGFERPQAQHHGRRFRTAYVTRFDKFLGAKHPHRVRRA